MKYAAELQRFACVEANYMIVDYQLRNIGVRDPMQNQRQPIAHTLFGDPIYINGKHLDAEALH
ncbi:hypothetical protein [Thalassobius sp. I31.1]|uniref:hypothetical protein n=1 Tax=Thalassobius sp. I31.1 TaxID=2109912 RepID=UPI000D1BB86F|nr:hypothetical protein [Thalassobius sp. I31.1]